MTASTEPRGGLDLGWSSGEDGWGDAMNANLLRLSRLGFHPSVLSATTTAPPGSPISGSGYIIPSGATGAWAGKTGQVAVWDGAAWAYAAPRDGWTMHVDGAGLTTYDNGIWSQANVVTAAGVGAEPYAGIPAQTSFWRSTAAGVRAWVQLVAADITDLATVLAGYLTKANPDFTGALKQGGTTRITSGGDAWLTSVQSASLVGAGDRPVAADLTGTLQPKTPDQFRNMIFALASSLKGAANGVAELGADVKVPVAQLPSAALLALGADSTTAHRGDHGTTAYTHSQIATGNPHGTTAADVGAAKAPSKVDISASTTIGSIDATAIKVTATDVNLTLSGGVNGQGWDIINPTASSGIAIPSGATLWKSNGFDVGPTTISLGGGRPIRITRIDANTWTMLGSQ